jgi:uncharacterized membrane protein YkvA (DUF1232 family)
MKDLVAKFYGWYKSTLRNTKYRWLIVAGSLIYLLSPIDISPDFLPIVGWIDDGILATLLVTELSQIALEALNQRQRPLTKTGDHPPVITVDV